MRLLSTKTRLDDDKMGPSRYENKMVARKMRFPHIFPHNYISALISVISNYYAINFMLKIFGKFCGTIVHHLPSRSVSLV